MSKDNNYSKLQSYIINKINVISIVIIILIKFS